MCVLQLQIKAFISNLYRRVVSLADERRDKGSEVTFWQSSTYADADEEYTHRATNI